jgi:ribonuclease HI
VTLGEELFAVLIGLAALDGPHEVTVKTDSEYVRVNFNDHLPTWRVNGWRLTNRKPVLNRDLWEALAEARIT